MQEHGGLRLIDKPNGITSFDVIRHLREQYKEHGEVPPKLGHAGTLDPAASGLLIIGVGREGTKQLDRLSGLDKTYEVTMKLGERTNTGDVDGETIETKEVTSLPTDNDMHKTLTDMIGTQQLPVPVYSAVKVNGEPLHKKARRGETVEPPVRTMDIHDIRLRNMYEGNGEIYMDFGMDVGSGVFVRSVVEEIGRYLGYPVMTVILRRTRVGKYRVEDAESLD